MSILVNYLQDTRKVKIFLFIDLVDMVEKGPYVAFFWMIMVLSLDIRNCSILFNGVMIIEHKAYSLPNNEVDEYLEEDRMSLFGESNADDGFDWIFPDDTMFNLADYISDEPNKRNTVEFEMSDLI